MAKRKSRVLGGTNLFNEITSFLSLEASLALAQLLVKETEYVSGKQYSSPQQLIKQYALTTKEMRDLFEIPAGMHAVDVVNHVLTNYPSWGEFIGGVCASLPIWHQIEQRWCVTALEKAIITANEKGIDH